MKVQERFIEKQVAGQAIEDEDEEKKKEEITKVLDFEDNKEEEEWKSEHE